MASTKRTKDEKRKPYQLLLSEAERRRYQDAADRDKRPLAQWIRVTLDAAAK